MIYNELFDNVLAFASLLAVVILALVQLIKKNTCLPRNVIPFIGLGIGLGIGAAAYPFTELDMALRLWAGGLAGLSATGLFELALNNREGRTMK
ncbi:holin [Paenibacillus tritici]|uniref:Holin n=1 Tax=Paenibacillus tritici TaxID=1873425 RepID=A0ABX2DV81_9BACL|nr:holin [Paenibacillus tritici]NQX48613.1 holin [Paenibacillus tritici]